MVTCQASGPWRLALCRTVMLGQLADIPVNAALPSNTLAIHGVGQTKELTELVPGILNQLGPDSLASLRKLAESYQSLTARNAADKKEGAEDDDEIPDLVESFDDAEGAEEKKLDDVE